MMTWSCNMSLFMMMQCAFEYTDISFFSFSFSFSFSLYISFLQGIGSFLIRRLANLQ